MPTNYTEQPVLREINTISPWIITKSTEKLIDFLKAAFNAKEELRGYNEDGSIGHAEVQIGNSTILMFDLKPEWPSFPSFIRLYLENGDEVYEQALKAGAVTMTKMTTHYWGDRVGRVLDPFGNIWWIQTHIEDVSPEDMELREKQNEYIEAMEYAQNSFNPLLTID